jgi:hypothetical protein
MPKKLSLFISTFALMGISLTMSGAGLCLSKEECIRSDIEGETHSEALVTDDIRSSKAVDSLYVGSFYNADQGVTLTINLIDTCVVAPNYEFLGKLNGYLWGNLHESWFITSYQLKEGKATLHLSNEMGSEDQVLLLTALDHSQIKMDIEGSNGLRRVEHRKWVKLPTTFILHRVDRPVGQRPLPRRYQQY